MFSNAFQSGFLSIFYSVGSSPLSLWDKAVKNGHIRRVIDNEVKSLVLEVSGTNVATTYITCPIKPTASLGVRLPFLVMVVKNMKKYFTFEIQIIDDKDMRRRFRVSNFQSTTKVRPFCTTMPIGLSAGWNQIQFNLADFTRRAYGTVYMETIRVQIHANVRIRRIYFSDRLYAEDELPSEYKLFLPIGGKNKDKEKDKAARAAGKQAKAAHIAEKPGDAEEVKVEEVEREIPSGAPPTPTEARDEGEAPAAEEAAAEDAGSLVAEIGEPADVEEVAEKPEEGAEAPPEGAEGGDDEMPAEIPAEGVETVPGAEDAAGEGAAEPAEAVEETEAPPPSET